MIEPATSRNMIENVQHLVVSQVIPGASSPLVLVILEKHALTLAHPLVRTVVASIYILEPKDITKKRKQCEENLRKKTDYIKKLSSKIYVKIYLSISLR